MPDGRYPIEFVGIEQEQIGLNSLPPRYHEISHTVWKYVIQYLIVMIFALSECRPCHDEELLQAVCLSDYGESRNFVW